MIQTVISRLRRRAVGVGIDLVEVADVAAALASPRADRYLDLVYSEAERRDCATPDGGVDPARLAARFAAKEAMAKALGAPTGMAWHDAEVVREESGRPLLTMTGTVRARADELGVTSVHLSLSHDAGIASAVVVLEADRAL